MIGLILPETLKYSPYVNYYVKILHDTNTAFEIITWNKKKLDEAVEHSYHFTVKDSQKIRKTVGYIGFRSWLLRLCKKQRYDKLIIFTIIPAILLSKYLLKNYAGKYILDIRDDSLARRAFGGIFKKVVEGASLVITSSHEFDSWIGFETILCHNVDTTLVEACIKGTEADVHGIYNAPSVNRIMFGGMLNEWQINLEIITLLKNNDAFRLIFHCPDSAGKNQLVDYCKENAVENVEFHGGYKKEEITQLYQCEADWGNIVRRESVVNMNALPNKLYDAAIAGVPVIVLKHNKAVFKYVEKYHLGMAFKSVDELCRDFLNRASVFDYKAYQSGRTDFLKAVFEESEKFSDSVSAWVREKKA